MKMFVEIMSVEYVPVDFLETMRQRQWGAAIVKGILSIVALLLACAASWGTVSVNTLLLDYTPDTLVIGPPASAILVTSWIIAWIILGFTITFPAIYAFLCMWANRIQKEEVRHAA